VLPCSCLDQSFVELASAVEVAWPFLEAFAEASVAAPLAVAASEAVASALGHAATVEMCLRSSVERSNSEGGHRLDHMYSELLPDRRLAELLRD